MSLNRTIVVLIAMVMITMSYISYLLVVGNDGMVLAALTGLLAGLAGWQVGKRQ